MPKVAKKKKLKSQVTSMRIVITNHCSCGSTVIIEKLISGIHGECVQCRKPFKLDKKQLLKLLAETDWRK
jgi:hypothetical protein